MPTPNAIVTAIAVCRTARLANAPATDSDVEALAEVWLDDLADLDDATFAAALKAHRTDPERGRWMPTPADLLKAAKGVAANPHEEAWAVIVDLLHHGDRGSGGLPSVREHLSPTHLKAFQLAGGMWALSRAKAEDVHWMKQAFLRNAQRLTDGPKALPAPAAPPAHLIAQAPPQARALLTSVFQPEEAGRAAHRARLVEQARQAAGEDEEDDSWR